MRIRVIGSTKTNHEISIDEVLKFSGHEAGICYMPDTMDALLSEDVEKTLRRANGTLKSGHHSVFAHVSYNFILEDIPKILAMVLNNEKVYNTSEKSARYTKMKTSKQEERLYEKWIEIYKQKIIETYPNLDEKSVLKLSQENARYLISVFTPATTMGYTVDARQLNYLINWSEDFIEKAEDTEFNKLLKPVLKEFYDSVKQFKIDGLNSAEKNRKFSLFADRDRKEEWGENYCVNYYATFSQLAHAHRHRSLYYEISLLEENKFIVPEIIKNTELEKEWLEDISSLQHNYPQGMLIKVNERGTVEKFIEKCQERLCGCAQLETVLQTQEILNKYLENTKESNIDVYNFLLPYSKGARCTFPNFKCAKPCVWGAKHALDRKI